MRIVQAFCLLFGCLLVSAARADANTLLHRVAGVSEYSIVGADLVTCDGTPDTTTVLTPSSTSTDIRITPVAGDNRSFYVDISPAATTSRTNVTVSLSANIPSSGSCAGQPAVLRTVQYAFDISLPPDLRAMTPRAVGAVTPGPHP